MRKYLQIIALTMLIFMTASFVIQPTLLAYDNFDYDFNSSNGGSSNLERNLGIAGLIAISIYGISRYISHRNQQKYEENMELGRAYLEDGRYDLAIKNLNEAKSRDNTVEVNRLLSEAELAYQKEHYERGSQYIEEENWEQAYRNFREVLEYGNYRDTEVKYEQVFEELRAEKLVRIAVLEFDDSATYRYNLGRRSTSLLTSEILKGNPKFIELVERERIDRILDEQKKSQTGLIEDSTAVELGNILGVDYLVVGNVLSGSVNRDRSSERVTLLGGEKATKYTVTKEAYTRIEFKVLNTSNGAIILSDSARETYREQEFCYNSGSVMMPSDEEMIDNVLERALSQFSERILLEFEI